MSRTKSTLIEQATEELSKLRARQEEVVKSVVNGLKPIMKKSKFFKQISWTQYTPGFNDGDVCEFGVHDMQVVLSKKGADFFNKHKMKPTWVSREDYTWDSDVEDGTDIGTIQDSIKGKAEIVDFEDMVELDEAVAEISEIQDFVSSNQDDMKVAFGDHAKIVVTSKGLEVEEYNDHE